MEVRLQALKGILQVFSEQNVRFISQGVDKLKHAQKYKYPIHPHNVAFMYLVEKAETFLKNEGKKGLIIMDNNEDRAQGIINDFHSYKRNGTAYGYAKKDIVHLVDSVYYTESFNSYSMQFSDVIGYVYSSHVLAKRMGKADTLGFFKKSLFEGTDALFAAKTLYCDIEPKHVTH